MQISHISKLLTKLKLKNILMLVVCDEDVQFTLINPFRVTFKQIQIVLYYEITEERIFYYL